MNLFIYFFCLFLFFLILGICNILCHVRKPSSLCYNSDNMCIYISSMECGIYYMYIDEIFMDSLFQNINEVENDNDCKNIETTGTLFALQSFIFSNISSFHNIDNEKNINNINNTNIKISQNPIGLCRQISMLEDNRIFNVLFI